jgi:hypothetical protein
MPETSDHLENLWDSLLSRETHLIRAAYASLTEDEQAAVLAHLQRMAVEDGWHPQQRLSAQAALDALDDFPPHKKSA